MLATLLLLAGLHSAPVIHVDDDGGDDQTSEQTPKCMLRETLLDRIAVGHEAVPLFVGMVQNGAALEIWHDISNPSDPWIAFISRPDGTSCLLMQGSVLGYADPNAKPRSPGDTIDEHGQHHPYRDPAKPTL